MFKLVLLTLVLVLVLVTFVSCKPQLKSPKIKLGNNGRIIGGQNAAPRKLKKNPDFLFIQKNIK
jgi:hypothetical protein